MSFQDLFNFKLDKKKTMTNLYYFSVDFNVPMKEGKITSNQRIVAALDTVKHVLGKNAKSVVCVT